MFSFRVDTTKFRTYIANFTERFSEAVKEESIDTLVEIARAMQVEAAPRQHLVEYTNSQGNKVVLQYGDKVTWDSERQRKAFFATDGFGHGIPYVRTGNYMRGYTVTEMPNGAKLSNAHPAGAIGGTLKASRQMVTSLDNIQTWQSRIHRRRWKKLALVVRELLTGINVRIVERFGKKK